MLVLPPCTIVIHEVWHHYRRDLCKVGSHRFLAFVPQAWSISRCLSPVCTVCARTCSSMIRPPSFPPTPALTRSPSPSVSPSESPRRVALSLSISAINCDAPFTPSSKRKKSSEKDDVDANDPSKFRDTLLGLDDATVLISGCGRPLCKSCCVESVQK